VDLVVVVVVVVVVVDVVVVGTVLGSDVVECDVVVVVVVVVVVGGGGLAPLTVGTVWGTVEGCSAVFHVAVVGQAVDATVGDVDS